MIGYDRRADVYVASDGSGLHKVGFSANLKQRLYHLTRAAGRPVTIEHVEPDVACAPAVEMLAHWILVDHHDHLEWFAVSADRAREAVKEAVRRVDAGERPTKRPFVLQRDDLGPRLEAQIEATRRRGETRRAFIRVAVEAELRKREKPSKG